jgi:hypothetical protein
MPQPTVATVAKQLLVRAAQNLGIPNPLSDVGRVIDHSLSFPLGQRYNAADPLSPSFSETTPENLGFIIEPDGPGVTPADKIRSATQAMQHIVSDRFGEPARHWLDGRLETVTSNGYQRGASYGASFGSGFDRNGINESFVQYEWGPMLMDSLPAPLYRIARTAMETLPGLRPSLSTIRCGRSSGSQQVTFEMERALPLANLQPLMERLGLGHRHASVMNALGFVLGARFVLPPDTAMLTFRPMRAGVEMRVDVNLDALPDPPAQLMALMRLQMTERPKGVQGFDRWLTALTPDGYPGPGTVSVLSVWCRPDLPARLALYLHPAALDPDALREAQTQTPVAGVSQSVAEAADWASSAWAPYGR